VASAIAEATFFLQARIFAGARGLSASALVSEVSETSIAIN
jgi:hypothetical protein